MKVTLDTNILPADDLIRLAGNEYDFFVVSVTAREVHDTPFEIHLEPLNRVAETGLWGESKWGEAVWAADDDPLETILAIISSGSFPKAGSRDSLTAPQKKQLRDGMILASHISNRRDIFVTNDSKAFINHGRREALELRLGMRIMTLDEFRGTL